MVLIYYEQLTCNWNFIYKQGEITLKINVKKKNSLKIKSILPVYVKFWLYNYNFPSYD